MTARPTIPCPGCGDQRQLGGMVGGRREAYCPACFCLYAMRRCPDCGEAHPMALHDRGRMPCTCRQEQPLYPPVHADTPPALTFDDPKDSPKYNPDDFITGTTRLDPLRHYPDRRYR